MEPGTNDAELAAATPPRPPRGPGLLGGFGTVVLYFLLQFGVSLLVGALVTLVVGFSYAFGVQARHGKVDPQAIQQLARHADVRILAITLTLVIAAALMLWFIRWRWRPLWSVPRPPGLGFNAPTSNWFFALAIVLGPLLAVLGGMLAHLLAGPHAPKQDISVWAHSVAMGYRLPLAFATVLVAPLVEEAVFRGVLLAGLMRRMPVVPAAIVSALVFGAVHLPDFKLAWYPVPTLVLLGIVLAWLRLSSRSLWPAFTAHAANNLLAVASWFVIARPHP